MSKRAKIQKSQETGPKEEVSQHIERLQQIMGRFRGRILSMRRGIGIISTGDLPRLGVVRLPSSQ